MIREREIESYFVKRVKQRSWSAMKFVSPSMTGVPDRLILRPGGHAEFVELKAPGEKPTPRQLRVHAQLRGLGFKVSVLDSFAAIEGWLSER